MGSYVYKGPSASLMSSIAASSLTAISVRSFAMPNTFQLVKNNKAAKPKQPKASSGKRKAAEPLGPPPRPGKQPRSVVHDNDSDEPSDEEDSGLGSDVSSPLTMFFVPSLLLFATHIGASS